MEPGRVELSLACHGFLKSLLCSFSKGVIWLFLATVAGVLPTVSLGFVHLFAILIWRAGVRLP